MLPSFSAQYLTPDDFSVPCRLRRCDESSSPCIDDGESSQTEARQHPEEITCTMRKWHKERTDASEFKSPLRRKISESQTKNHDAELILAPAQCYSRVMSGGELSKMAEKNTPVLHSKRFASFGTPEFIDDEERAQHQQSWSDAQQRSESISSQIPQSPIKEDITIPVNDIIKVTTRGEEDKSKKQKRGKKGSSKKNTPLNEECRQQPTVSITTSSSTGSYELIMESTNEQLVLVTFLKVNSKKGKVLFSTEAKNEIRYCMKNDQPKETNKSNNKSKNNSDAAGESNQDDTNALNGMELYDSVIDSNASNLTHGISQSTGEKSFDVEAFTAKKMNERLETESVSEKMNRRMLRFFSSLDDLTTSFTKCACACFGDSTVVDHTITIDKEPLIRPRRNTASTASLSDNGKPDIDPAASNEGSKAITTELVPDDNHHTDRSGSPYLEPKMLPREELITFSQMPSGLSVEPDDESEDNNFQTHMRQSYLPQAVPVMASDI